MEYEVIREIKNSCSNNQLRDVFVEEVETDSPEQWVKAREPFAGEIISEQLEDGYRITVSASGLITQYTFTEI